MNQKGDKVLRFGKNINLRVRQQISEQKSAGMKYAMQRIFLKEMFVLYEDDIML